MSVLGVVVAVAVVKRNGKAQERRTAACVGVRPARRDWLICPVPLVHGCIVTSCRRT